VYAKNASSNVGGRALKFGDRNNFGPRFGFAWRPVKSHELVVRGGYGVYYEQEHPSGPILHAINPPPGGIGAPDAAYSGFGFTRDFTAPALSTNPVPSLLWRTSPAAPQHSRSRRGAAVESGGAKRTRRRAEVAPSPTGEQDFHRGNQRPELTRFTFWAQLR
jgi:hypothetical protein